MRHATAIFVFITLVTAGGCASQPVAKAPEHSPFPLTPVIALPSASQLDSALETSIPAVAGEGWVAGRNDGKLGSSPSAISTSLVADRMMRDTQWVNSGRPYANFRYTVRIRSIFRP